MREQLKKLTEKDYWVYGISESDFDHVLDLVTEMIQARNEQYEVESTRVRQERPEAAEDILDDVAYYRHTDNQYLWQFALWRLQGLIEAVIAHQIVEVHGTKKLFGLKAKLESLTAIGYTITTEEIEELLDWASLRNAISHAPPEQYRPVPLTKEDIFEYHHFAKRLYIRWRAEKSSMSVG
ncbi:hypothetical protein [Vibrio maritimus]|uniref:hypothetical protein n=1 Tax=Vibrio maritimus TaxID=990268 RepID=UPI003734F510